MRSEHPQEAHIPGLRRLWQEAFGDTDAFLDGFFSTAFSPERCLCVCRGEQVLSAAYWLDGQLPEGKCAYIYAVATAKACRGQGLAKSVMAQIRETLQRQGYVAAILVPGEPSLADFYGAMGYGLCGSVQQIACTAAETAVPLKEITAAEYAAARRKLLPPGGVVQERENLEFLQTQWKLYAGEKSLLAATQKDGTLTAMEYLGEPALCGGILRTLNCSRGTFRMPGAQIPFAMYLPFFESSIKPGYFGLAFD